MGSDQIVNGLGQAVVENGQSFFADPQVAFVLFLIFTAAVLILAGFFIRLALRRHYRKVFAFRRTIFQVLMPKEPEEQAKKEEAIQKKDLKEVIAEVESFYSNLAGISHPRRWGYFLYVMKKFWTGYHSHISLEIVAHEGKIKFYVAAPDHLAEYVEQQIQAAYPSAHLEKVDDYNMFEAVGYITGTYLCPTRSQFLPLKTYKKMDFDPLEGITNNLSKLNPDEGIAVQILIRPAKSKWHHKAIQVAREMHKGHTLEGALGSSHAGVSGALLWLLSLPYQAIKYTFDSFFSSKSKNQPESEEGQNERQQLKNAPVRILKREEELVQALEEKFSKAYFETNIRLVASAKTKERTLQILRGTVASFAQFTYAATNNRLKETLLWFREMFINDFIYRNFREMKKFILNAEELISIYHFPLPTTETPNIIWLSSRKAAPPVNLPSAGLVLGKSVYRGAEQLVRIKDDDRRRHIYIIGKSGTGKSVLLSNMAIQDVIEGRGLCLVDPHGDLVEDVLAHVPKERADDVIIFNPSDTERPVGLNMLEARSEEEKDFAVQEMISIFYKLFPPEMIGPMFEHNMRNVMLTLMSDLENPGTIAEIPRMFTDTDFQKSWVVKLKDPIVRAFWEKEMAKTTDFHKSEMLGYLISKVGRFVENEMMRNIIGQQKSGFDLRDVMDKGKILLVNLSKGKTGEVNSNLLGLIIVSKLQMAALGRADIPAEQRKDFYLYIDEFQNFITPSIATILSEARKYKLSLTIAHQYLGQLSGSSGATDKQGDNQIRDAVLGTTGTMIVFKIGAEDAEIIAKEFAPTVNQFDLVNVEKFNAYIKLLIDNQSSRPFNMETLPPQKGNRELAEKVRELSRLKHGRAKAEVQAEIMERTRLGEAAKEMIDNDIEKTL